MADAVYNELQEDLRRQQLLDWMRRYGPWVVVAALLAVFGTAGYVFYQRQHEAKLEAVTAALYQNLGANAKAQPAESAGRLDSFADSETGRQAVLARLMAAGLKLRANDKPGTLADLQRVIDDKQADDSLHGAATIMYVQNALDSAAPDELQLRLAPYQDAGSAYRFQAWELGALVAYRAGDHERAQQLLQNILNDEAVPASARDRAADLQRVL